VDAGTGRGRGDRLGRDRGGPGADRAALGVDSLHLLPETLGSAEAVALLGTGRTAVALVETAGIGRGDTVLSARPAVYAKNCSGKFVATYPVSWTLPLVP
jgi:NADPH:quinone reductase-like Zn-dependent oxidoreductase